ncbi:MAG: methyl-accepting chemotaxis protein [Desulfobacteraceae bacterium]|nr:methyl-accepting chemotaxis protein [Desulfobacteraceae bacterium]
MTMQEEDRVSKIKTFKIIYHIFKLLYIAGIIIATVFAFRHVITKVIPLEYFLSAIHKIPGELLGISLLHMTCIILVGLFTEKKDKTIVGENIQTAGYLHTLIGFSAAIIALREDGQKGFEIGRMLIPLASALSTSIIGWFIGSEIERWGTSEDIQTRLVEVEEELKIFTRKFRIAYGVYIDTINDSGQKFHDIHANYAESVDNSMKKILEFSQMYENLREDQVGTLEKMKIIADDVTGSFSQVSNSVKMLNKTMQSTSDAGNSFSLVLSEIQRNADDINQNTSQIHEKLSEVNQGFQQLSDISGEVRQQLKNSPEAVQVLKKSIDAARDIHSVMEKISEPAHNLAKTMETASKQLNEHLGSSFLHTLSDVQEKGNEISTEASNVAREFQDATGALHSITTRSKELGEELQKLIKFIMEIKQ